MLTLNDILVPVSNQEASKDFCSLHFIVLHFSNLNKSDYFLNMCYDTSFGILH